MPDSEKKIISLEALAEKARELKSQGKRVVLSHGIFDLVHNGHISHLKKARSEGDVLFVTLTGDKYVNLGPGYPMFPENLRAETLAALGCVDYIAINNSSTAANIIEVIKPYGFVKGGEYKTSFDDPSGDVPLGL